MGDLSRNFSRREFECPCCGKSKVTVDLVRLLQRMRDESDFPYIISSGFRCEQHNKAVGGAVNSDHLEGTAADVRYYNGTQMYKLLKLALKHGADRIGVGENFIHISIGSRNLREVGWTYYAKKAGA